METTSSPKTQGEGTVQSARGGGQGSEEGEEQGSAFLEWDQGKGPPASTRQHRDHGFPSAFTL